MFSQVLLIAQLIACGDSEKAVTPPPPPAQAPAPAPKPAAEKAAETPAAEKAAEKPAAEPGDDAAAGIEAAAADAAAGSASVEGTQVASKKESRKFASKMLKATDKAKLLALGKQMLTNTAKKEGYSLNVESVKLTKVEKKSNNGGFSGIAQGEGSRTVYTYAAGNQVSVAQEDKSKKDALIKSVSGSDYVVTYADGSEATVKKSSLSPRK